MNTLKSDLRVISFIILLPFFLISCSIEPEIQRKDETLSILSNIAKEAVETATNTNLSLIDWETADYFRFKRLLYRSTYNVYRHNLSDPAKARLFSYASAESSSDTLLGLYKHNIKKIFIRSDRITKSDLSDEKSLDKVAKCHSIFYSGKSRVNTEECLKKHSVIRSLEEEIYLALFIHEYTHAADVQRFTQYFYDEDIYYPGKSNVFSTLLEGNAEYLSKTLCVDLKCSRGFEYLAEKTTDFSHIKDTRERKHAKNKEERRIFQYDKGRELVEYLYEHSKASDPVEEFVTKLPDSRMVVLYPENIKKFNSSTVSTIDLINSLDAFKAIYPIKDWLHNKEVVQPPRMFRLLTLFTNKAFKSVYNKEEPYLQSVLFTLEKQDLFDVYNDAETDKSNYFIVRNLGSEEKARAIYLQEQKHIQEATTSTKINLSQSVLPIDKFNSLSFIDKALSDPKNDLFRTVSIVQHGQYIIVAVTDNDVFKNYDEIATSINMLFNNLPIS